MNSHRDNIKSIDIPIKHRPQFISKSWNNEMVPKKHISISPPDNHLYTKHKKIYSHDYDKPYDAITNCKSAGIIPYAVHNGKIYFLFQRSSNPFKRKDSGWNDFGGKKINPTETTADVAAREFSEETSCLFYIKEMIDKLSDSEQIDNDELKSLKHTTIC